MSQSQHPETPRKLPVLLEAVPRWYPSAWAPPAETLTGASVTVAAIASAYLFRDPLVRTLFRLPFDAFLLAATATATAAFVAWKGSTRPGASYPRYWAAFLSLFCLGVTIWGVVERIRSPRGSPRVHALSAIAFMATITLLPRVFRVHPYSRWVQHVAPVSLAVVVFVFLPGAYLAERKVIKDDKEEIRSKMERLKEVSSTVTSAVDHFRNSSSEEVPVRKLHDLSLINSFPDEFEWQSGALLGLQGDMQAGASDLTRGLVNGLTNPDAQELSEPQLHLNSASFNRPVWVEDAQFPKRSAEAAAYYFELGRIFHDVGRVVEGSPAEAEYQARKEELEKHLARLRRLASGLWTAASIEGREAPLQQLLESRVGSLDGLSLGDLRGWKSMARAQAISLLGQPGCAKELVSFHPIPETQQVPDPLVPGGYQTQVTTKTFERIECYAYQFSTEHNRVQMLAELHLHYNSTRTSIEGTSTRTTVKSVAHPVLLYFDIPSGAKQYQNNVMQVLADWIREHYHVRLENKVGVTPTGGFRVHSAGVVFEATTRRITRRNVSTIEIRVD